MTDLKKIIVQLEEVTYKTIESDLIKNNSENFLYLLKAYKKQNISDDKIIKDLKLNKNSFYVLKSRLHDKIQKHLTTHINITKEDVLNQLQNLSDICYNTPRETANSLLEKLERDLLHFDMHFELQLVYSTLKKNHLYSNNYFYYSQLYNKQVALGFSQEKVEELLGEFCLILSQYNFSKNALLLDKLLFLRNEIINHNKLNPSRQITIIKNIVEIQLGIFCRSNINHGISVIELLQETSIIIKELPKTLQHEKWNIILDYLFFENYYNTGQLKLAGDYYEKTDKNTNTLLLHTGLCCCNQFLVTKICFLQETIRLDYNPQLEKFSGYFDPNDMYSRVMIAIYDSMGAYYKGNIKESITILNDIYEQYSFKDYIHIQIELKVITAFMMLENKKNNDDAYILLNNLKRKIKFLNLESQYNHACQLINLLLLEKNEKPNIEKKRNLCNLYLFQNGGQYKIAPYFNNIIKTKYS